MLPFTLFPLRLSFCLQADLFPGAVVYFGSDVKTGFCVVPFIFMLILIMFLCIGEECNKTQQYFTSGLFFFFPLHRFLHKERTAWNLRFNLASK